MDIDFDVDTGRFCLRAAGIFRHADKIPFQRKIGDERWALPGGKIIYGESSNEAIEREFVEPPTALLRHQHPMPLGQGLKQFLDDALHKSKMGAGQLKGFLFERLEAAKFNADAARKGLDVEARLTADSPDGGTDPRVDIEITRQGNVIQQVQAKSHNDPAKLAKAVSDPKFDGTTRLVPSDKGD